jgi:hypothetical protein
MLKAAELLWQHGDLVQARKLHEEVLKRRLRDLGTHHPDTIQSKHCLAVLASAEGDLKRAYELEKEIWEQRSDSYYNNDPISISLWRILPQLLVRKVTLMVQRNY